LFPALHRFMKQTSLHLTLRKKNYLYIFIKNLYFIFQLCCRGGLLFPSRPPSSFTPPDSIVSFNRDYHIQCELPHYIYLGALLTCLFATLYISMSAIIKLVYLLLVALSYIFAMEYVVKTVFQRSDEQLRLDLILCQLQTANNCIIRYLEHHHRRRHHHQHSTLSCINFLPPPS